MDLVTIISTTGFPIAIAVYLLWERRTATYDLIKVIKKLEIAIIKLEAKLK